MQVFLLLMTRVLYIYTYEKIISARRRRLLLEGANLYKLEIIIIPTYTNVIRIYKALIFLFDFYFCIRTFFKLYFSVFVHKSFFKHYVECKCSLYLQNNTRCRCTCVYFFDPYIV